jgi:nucleoid-associated protein YgaU
MRTTKMEKKIYLALTLSLTLIWGCSSSPTNTENEELAGDAIPELDAGTDAVPMGELEKIDGELAATAPEPTADPALDQPAGPEGAEMAAAAPAADPSMPVDDAPAAPTAEPAALADVPAPVSEPSAPEPVVPDSGETESYTIQQGDTLMKVAFETYGDLYEWKKIYEMNRDKLTDPNRIPPGTVLTLGKPSSPVSIDRNGEKYMIRSGDTLGTISDDIYGTPRKWKKLWENNRQLIKDPNKIFAGFYLYYTITPEERQERETRPQPLAETSPAVEPEAPAAVDTASAVAPQAPVSPVSLEAAPTQQAQAPVPAPADQAERAPAAVNGGG